MRFRKTLGSLLIGAAMQFMPSYALAEEPVVAEPTEEAEPEQQRELRDPFGAIELMAGDESATLDWKLFVPLSEELTLFNRLRSTAVYEDAQKSAINVTSLGYNVAVPGLDLFVESDLITGKGIDLRAGVQYFGKFDDFSVFQLFSIGLQGDPDFNSITNLNYAPSLTEDVGLYFNIENFTNFGLDGHSFSTQRLRAGFALEDVQFGVAMDLFEVGEDVALEDVTYNAGGFVRVGY